ncbi:hypothetical protein BU15DRAFT_59038 [Melanogaster broomeanus]|nr:hypothetical protein BU15DRAFT_59038 [Melanogaster broomeanus]
MKRRLSAAEDHYDQQLSESSSKVPSASPNGRQKRPRYSTLEHGFKHMTLSNTPPFTLPASPSAHTNTEVVDMSAQASHDPCASTTSHIIPPGPVETPTSPPLQTDIMEVESDIDRSVTVDLCPTSEPSHASDDREGTTDSGQLEIKEVQISSVVLERLKMQTTSRPPLIPISCAVSQALILFRPLRPPSPKSTLGAMLGDGEGLASTEITTPFVPEGDAMDVE